MIHNDWFDSLHRHQEIYCQLKQQLTAGNPKATGGNSCLDVAAWATFGQHHQAKQLDLSPDQWHSVLTERPTDHRQPMDMTVLGYAMALGLAVLIGVAVWKFLEGRADKGSG